MKILLISNLYPNKNEPNRGVFNFQQIESLSKFVDIIGIVPISWFLMRNWKDIDKQNLTFKDRKNIKHPKYFYTPRVFRCMYGFFYFFSILPTAIKIISRDKPDVIMGTWIFPDGFSAVLLGKIFKLPVYIKVHGSDVHSVEGKCRRALTSWTLRSCNKIISVSNSLANQMKKEFNIPEGKITVIPNGILKDKFYLMSKVDALKVIDVDDKHEKNIVFVGNLKPVKNIMMLIKSYKKMIQDSNESIGLHILGEGELYTEALSYIEKHNLNACVYLHGRVLHDDVSFWMNYADVFVLPSKNEGMPNVVLEALSCGTPVVASNIEATRELIDDGINGYRFDLHDPDDFVNKLKLGLELKKAPEFDHKHDMIISWQENAKRLHQVIA